MWGNADVAMTIRHSKSNDHAQQPIQGAPTNYREQRTQTQAELAVEPLKALVVIAVHIALRNASKTLRKLSHKRRLPALFAQIAFRLREEEFARIDLWTIRRRVPHCYVRSRQQPEQQLANAFGLVHAAVVQNQVIA